MQKITKDFIENVINSMIDCEKSCRESSATWTVAWPLHKKYFETVSKVIVDIFLNLSDKNKRIVVSDKYWCSFPIHKYRICDTGMYSEYGCKGILFSKKQIYSKKTFGRILSSSLRALIGNSKFEKLIAHHSDGWFALYFMPLIKNNHRAIMASRLFGNTTDTRLGNKIVEFLPLSKIKSGFKNSVFSESNKIKIINKHGILAVKKIAMLDESPRVRNLVYNSLSINDFDYKKVLKTIISSEDIHVYDQYIANKIIYEMPLKQALFYMNITNASKSIIEQRMTAESLW